MGLGAAEGARLNTLPEEPTHFCLLPERNRETPRRKPVQVHTHTQLTRLIWFGNFKNMLIV